jgi:hypothetical protein
VSTPTNPIAGPSRRRGLACSSGEHHERHGQGEQRDGGVPDAGQHARDVSLAVGEQRERRDVEQDGGDRELGPEAGARGQPLAAQSEDRQQRGRAHEHPAQ